MLDLELSIYPVSEERVEEVFDLVRDSELDTEVKQGFSQRRVEFLEDFSGNIAQIMAAQENHTKLYKGKSALVPLAGRKRSQDGERYASSNCDFIKLNTKTSAVLAISLSFITCHHFKGTNITSKGACLVALPLVLVAKRK